MLEQFLRNISKKVLWNTLIIVIIFFTEALLLEIAVVRFSFLRICISNYFWSIESGLVLFIVFLLIIAKHMIKRKPQEKTGATKSETPPNPERNLTDEPTDQILEWAKSDIPAQYDYFGHCHKAKKIANRITKSIGEKGNATVGLRGGYGSGKTTITNLIPYYISQNENERKQYIFCHVSCWGFNNTKATQQYIIESIVDAMSKARIDTDHLLGIPK
jgi:hypothetical protein